jgi:hypothetical protein
MKNFLDIIVEKILFKKLKNAFYSIKDNYPYDDNNFYFINFGDVSLKLFKLKPLFYLITHFKDTVKFKNKIGFLKVNRFSKTYLNYISEISEIFDIVILMEYKNELYIIRENTVSKVHSNDNFYFKTTKFYFLNESTELLYQLMDIRLENPHFLLVNNISGNFQDLELNSISSALSIYTISMNDNVFKIFKPENNKYVEYKIKEHFILKFNLKNLENLKNGLTKFDDKKVEVLLKYI